VRLIAFIEYAAVAAGIGGMIAGHFFAIPKAFQFGVFLIGAGFALAGLEALATRRMGFRASDDAYHAYAGAPAVIVGLMFLVMAAAVIGTAYLLNEGLWPKTLAYLVRRPGPVLAVAGLMVVGMGVLFMLNPHGRSGWAWRIFVYVPSFLFGLLLILAGFAAMAGGAWEWLDPQAFQAFVKTLPQRLASLLRF
jgi:hypothetical protein